MSKKIATGMLSGVTINGIPINTSKPCNAANYTNCSSRAVSYVVMHYTGNAKDTASGNCNYFRSGGRRASAHLFVDETSIYQSVELRDRAWHCGTSGRYYHSVCRNSNAIGIEMCTSGNYKVSDKTKENAAQLCAYICKLLGITAAQVDTYVLRHWNVSHTRIVRHRWRAATTASGLRSRAALRRFSMVLPSLHYPRLYRWLPMTAP